MGKDSQDNTRQRLEAAFDRFIDVRGMSDQEVAELQAKQAFPAASGSMGIGAWKLDATSILAWLVVGVPLGWGVWITLRSALVLFH